MDECGVTAKLHAKAGAHLKQQIYNVNFAIEVMVYLAMAYSAPESLENRLDASRGDAAFLVLLCPMLTVDCGI